MIDLFEEQYAGTELKHKLAIRTSGVTISESVAEFADKVEPSPRRRGPPAEGIVPGTNPVRVLKKAVFVSGQIPAAYRKANLPTHPWRPAVDLLERSAH